jgi:hypothetical protein
VTGFYVVYIEREYLWLTVPFCKECADRRVQWEKRDRKLLWVALITSCGLAVWFSDKINAEPWQFWVVFLPAAAVSTALCNLLLHDYRAVRIKKYSSKTVTLAFNHSEYGREFGRLNVLPTMR